MKRILINLVVSIFILIITLLAVLSSIGIQTNKFNKFISDKASQAKNINLELDTIKFKLDVKELSLFLETQNPIINYKDISIPVQYIKLYIDFLSLLKSEPKIIKANILLEELNISQIKQLSVFMKPSNFKRLLNNRVKNGKIISEIEIFLNEKGLLNNFIAKGEIEDLKVELLNGLDLIKTNLSFFADNNDILIKNIQGKFEDIEISEGDIKLNLENGIKISSNFNSKIDLNKSLIVKYINLLEEFKNIKKVSVLKADLNNSFLIELDQTYKVKDYNYNISGNLKKIKYELPQPIKNTFLTEKIKEIYFSNFKIQTVFSPTNNSLKGTGKYSFNNLDFLKINLENDFNKHLANLKLEFDYGNSLKLETINYNKSKDSIANIYIDLERKEKNLNINKLNYNEGNNSIKIDNLIIRENKFLSFNNIEVATLNNNFSINNYKKILIKGSKFDATNLIKSFNKTNDVNVFQNINSQIEIDFKNIKVPMSEKIQNFKLIGDIKKGKFVKIISKGDFGGNNFLDISMKKDKKTEKKFLEIYSDLPRPLLTEYSFFNGLSGGKLLFTSMIDGMKVESKLKIENFKVINAPGLIKLLSLADLGGLADLAGGDGLSFDLLEVDMKKDKDFLELKEILALGPSMSVLMEGYQNKNLTSLRGTLVPAKTLNKMISKIPVIGNIVIPKEVGEGLFGISFKMKGPKGNIKTTINPIKTLTPRFIQKIITRNKQTK